MDECSPKLCPKCQRHGMCIDSRENSRYVRRRYKCMLLACNHRWTTAEFLVGQGTIQANVDEFIDSLGRAAAEARIKSTIDKAIESLKECL